MRVWKLLWLGLVATLTYLAYLFLKRPASQQDRQTLHSLLTVRPRKHWGSKGRVPVIDDGTFTENIQRVANAKFGDHANRICIACLVPETQDRDKKAIAVFVDGLCVGYIPDRYAMGLYVELQRSGLDTSPTSCDAHIGGGGVGLDGKRRPYSIALNLSWFET